MKDYFAGFLASKPLTPTPTVPIAPKEDHAEDKKWLLRSKGANSRRYESRERKEEAMSSQQEGKRRSANEPGSSTDQKKPSGKWEGVGWEVMKQKVLVTTSKAPSHPTTAGGPVKLQSLWTRDLVRGGKAMVG